MSKLEDLKPYLRETLSLQDIILTLGHDQDKLLVVFTDNAIGIAINKEGRLYGYPSALRPPDLEKEAFTTEWTAACQTWNDSSQEERKNLVTRSNIRQRAVSLIAQLAESDLLPIQKIGFPCPFCGAHVVANGTEASVLHLQPPCARFLELDPLTFLKQCRFTLEGN